MPTTKTIEAFIGGTTTRIRGGTTLIVMATPHISAVPEANAGWVLVAFIGAVLLFSARKLFRESATE
jgi:hypothetical protein